MSYRQPAKLSFIIIAYFIMCKTINKQKTCWRLQVWKKYQVCLWLLQPFQASIFLLFNTKPPPVFLWQLKLNRASLETSLPSSTSNDSQIWMDILIDERIKLRNIYISEGQSFHKSQGWLILMCVMPKIFCSLQANISQEEFLIYSLWW